MWKLTKITFDQNSLFFFSLAYMSAILKLIKKIKQLDFQRKLSKLHIKDRAYNFVCTTRANKSKQWTHYSTLNIELLRAFQLHFTSVRRSRLNETHPHGYRIEFMGGGAMGQRDINNNNSKKLSTTQGRNRHIFLRGQSHFSWFFFPDVKCFFPVENSDFGRPKNKFPSFSKVKSKKEKKKKKKKCPHLFSELFLLPFPIFHLFTFPLQFSFFSSQFLPLSPFFLAYFFP